MILCKKCGTENPDDNIFCGKCGEKLNNQDENIKPTILDAKKAMTNYLYLFKNKIFESFKNKKNIGVISIFLVVVLVAIICLYSLNNPLEKFKRSIIKNEYIEALNIYNKDINGNKNSEDKAITFLRNEIEQTEEKFLNNKINYDNATKILKTIKYINVVNEDVDKAIDNIDALNESRIAFKKATNFIKNLDYENALLEYKKVIPKDKNYKKAQNEINKYKIKYKNQVIEKAKNYAGKKDYTDAILALSTAMNILPNDSDIISLHDTYEKIEEEIKAEEEKQRIADLINKQELVVVNCNVINDLLFDNAQVIVKNTSNKVVKNFEVGILMYDENGYPVKADILAGGDELFIGKAENVNIQPNETFGYGYAWNLYTNIGTVKKIIACVIDVQYYDGSEWINEYYNYWKEKYLDKPLNQSS
ncbi:DUF5780 domain-containing protein [Thermoanaerobacterium thermosaccharolyticum]|uniref:DUF5780 domain-containing protein n=1 Tax=Thermoanaerobacterium thermosaccharolyticum TaxID=1517 RepID=UPI0017803306|nr:DUF5780 domain-containing protein [Thermoanaerobacterium thermosaccharolyticum]MBE0068000.1 zinc ribbon domain-containing protein [Thermoanaerobacterium thermosaccharolyticum]MBE0227744.1 zinc ribbon domain-containing protein [Thermoanaerobacterium thermosaccharolyticum]